MLVPNPRITTGINLNTVLDFLQQSKFIGMPLYHNLSNETSNSFVVGEKFLHLMTFMGCSPYIELEPLPDGKPFCYIQIDGVYSKLQLRYSEKTQAPRCNICRKPIIEWRKFIALWLEQPTQNIIECPLCDHKQCVLDLNWRKTAGCGYLFINIENIFPGEATPVPKFLIELTTITNISWQYFYL